MERRDFLRLGGACAAGALLAACGGRAEQTAEPVRYFRYAENQAEDYPTVQAARYFAQLVEARSEGRMQVLVYPDATLGDETSVVEQMQLGMIDFSRVSLAVLADLMPRLNVLQMPYLYTDADQMWRVLDGPIGQQFLNGMADIGLCGLSWFDAGARSFYSRQGPIRTLEDMQGLTVRVQESSLMTDMVLALGGKPVSLAFDQVYASLQSGSIDAAENNLPSYESTGHMYVAPYFSEDWHSRLPEVQLLSKRVLDGLTEEQRALLRGAAQESAVYERELWVRREEESYARVLSSGARINPLSLEELERFRQAVAPLYGQYCGDAAELVEAIHST